MDRIISILCEDQYTSSHLAQFLEVEMLHTTVVEKMKTQILCQKMCFFLNRALYEIMWKNTVELGRPQMIIWQMHIACWIPKSTNT
jgi:hypothetical protein